MGGGGKARRQVKQKGKIKMGQNISLEEASAYVSTVKETFERKGQIGKYYEFLQLLNDFNAKTIPFQQLSARIKDLFRLHPHLIIGFNVFLTRQYHIDPDSASPSS